MYFCCHFIGMPQNIKKKENIYDKTLNCGALHNEMEKHDWNMVT